METGLLHLHNILRWVVLLLLLVVLFRSFAGMKGRRSFTAGDRKNALFLMISADVQLLLGGLLYFMGPWGIKNIQNQGMGAVMGDSTSRFWAVEHLVGMLIAIVLIHAGYNAVKKQLPDAVKFRKLFWCALAALVLIFLMMPWPWRELIGRPWFPGA